MTPEDALNVLSAMGTFGLQEHVQAVAVLTELVEGAPEIQCPSCHATVRARMADAEPARVTCRACGHANRVTGDHVESWEHPVLGSGETAGGNPAARQVGESYREYGDRLYGMYRALLVDVERLREVERAARAWADVHNDPRGRPITPVAQALHDALRRP